MVGGGEGHEEASPRRRGGTETARTRELVSTTAQPSRSGPPTAPQPNFPPPRATISGVKPDERDRRVRLVAELRRENPLDGVLALPHPLPALRR
jgi:hypothetical protein